MGKLAFRNTQCKASALILALALGCCVVGSGFCAASDDVAGSPPINMNIKDAPIAEVMSMLSEASGINIVVGQDVTGTIPSVNLRNITVEDALRYIALSAGLYWYREANGFIVSAKELSASVRQGGATQDGVPPVATWSMSPAVPATLHSALPARSSAAPAPPTAPTAVAPAGPAIRAIPVAPVRSETPIARPLAGSRTAPLAPQGPAVGSVASIVRASAAMAPAVPAVPAVSAVVPAATAVAPSVARSAASAGPEVLYRPAVVPPLGGRSIAAPVAPAVTPRGSFGSRTLWRTGSGEAAVPKGSRGITPAAPTTPGVPGSAKVGATDGPDEDIAEVPEATGTVSADVPSDDEALALAQLPAAANATGAYGAERTLASERVLAAGTTAPTGQVASITDLIEIKYADPADIALLLGGSVSHASLMRPSGQYRAGRRARASHSAYGNSGNGSGLGGSDRLYMQELGLGGGLGRGSSTGSSGGRGGTSRSGRGGTSGQGGGQGMGMRPEGVDTIIAYMPQNSLLVSGDPASIDQLREVLALLDVPVKQVEISTKFIEVDVTNDHAFGIDWFVSNGSLEFFNLGFMPGEAVNNVVRWSKGKFEATLGIVKSMNRGQIINEPHVTTQNNVPAYISFYTTIPYFSASVTFNEAGRRDVDFEEEEIDVEQTLEVTPRINADDTVTMYLTPIMEDQTGVVLGPNGEQLPIVASQEVETQVTVADGETIVLGGMIRKQRRYNTRSTPLLSEIPIIGNLFRSKLDNTQNSELLIFVTPRIMRDIPAP